MKTNKDWEAIAEKQAEIIKCLEGLIQYPNSPAVIKRVGELESELSSLESQEVEGVSAEEIIIKKVGEFWWICGKHRPEFLEAMEEYANSSKVTDEGDPTYQEIHDEHVKLDDAELLREIYERSDMPMIVQSDIYLRGFSDGQGYAEDKSGGNPDCCPGCGNSIYNCRCD